MLWHILMTNIIAQGDKNSSNFETVRELKVEMFCVCVCVRERETEREMRLQAK